MSIVVGNELLAVDLTRIVVDRNYMAVENTGDSEEFTTSVLAGHSNEKNINIYPTLPDHPVSQVSTSATPPRGG